MMTKVFPVIFGLITLGINAAATTYFVVSNAWRIGQQHLVIGKMYDQAIAAGDSSPARNKEPDPPKDESDNGAKAKPKPGAKPPGPGAKKPPAANKPPTSNAGGKANGAGGNGGRQGMTSGARRKKKRKR